MLNIQKKRVNYKPFEYPEVVKFIELINKTFWVHSEVDFSEDIQNFNSHLAPHEKEAYKRSLLSIAQIEVGVKTFWGNLFKYFPKPEFNGLGSTFAECEYRHSEAYSRLLEVLGYNNEFEGLIENPIFAKRLEILNRELSTDDIFKKMVYFIIVIENSSLFSHFATILSFANKRGVMKKTANIVAWTSMDENVHAIAGTYIINKMVEEGYSIDVEELRKNILEYIKYEEELLDYIYEHGELDFFTKTDVLNFIKRRIDNSMENLGVPTIFNISDDDYRPMQWFDQEIYMSELDDFFAKRPTAYTKHDGSITGDDLF